MNKQFRNHVKRIHTAAVELTSRQDHDEATRKQLCRLIKDTHSLLQAIADEQDAHQQRKWRDNVIELLKWLAAFFGNLII